MFIIAVGYQGFILVYPYEFNNILKHALKIYL